MPAPKDKIKLEKFKQNISRSSKKMWSNKKFKKKMSIIKKELYAKGLTGIYNGFGKNNPNYKGGKVKRADNYIIIYKPKHPFAINKKYVLEHRLIMEKYIGRYLTKKEVVHHINNINNDNRIENLFLCKNNKEHFIKYHNLKRNRLGQFLKNN